MLLDVGSKRHARRGNCWICFLPKRMRNFLRTCWTRRCRHRNRHLWGQRQIDRRDTQRQTPSHLSRSDSGTLKQGFELGVATCSWRKILFSRRDSDTLKQTCGPLSMTRPRHTQSGPRIFHCSICRTTGVWWGTGTVNSLLN